MKPRAAILTCVVILVGCGPLEIERYPQANTTAPTSFQIEQCRQWMHINPDLEIVAEGLHISTGMDTSAAFKFVAKTDAPEQLFDRNIVDPTEYKMRDSLYGLHEDSVNETWWDVSKRNLTGNNFWIPNAEALNIGFEKNDDGTITVYAFWHET